MKKLIKKNKIQLLWLMGVVALAVVTLMPNWALPEDGFPLDKILRMILFCCMAFIPLFYFPDLRTGFYMALSMAILGFVLEYLQKFIPGRHYSPSDMISNNVGVVLGAVTGALLRLSRREKQ